MRRNSGAVGEPAKDSAHNSTANGPEAEIARLTRERDEAREQQTATADALKVISRSAFDLDSVLATLVASAAKLCEAKKGVIFLREENDYRLVSNYGFSAEFEAFAKTNPFPTDGGSTTTRAADPDRRFRSSMCSKTRREAPWHASISGWAVIAPTLACRYCARGNRSASSSDREAVRPFTERQIELVRDVRRPGGDRDRERAPVRRGAGAHARLAESLQQQTATAEVLKVISRSTFDLKSVLTTLTVAAKSLCGAASGSDLSWTKAIYIGTQRAIWMLIRRIGRTNNRSPFRLIAAH